MKSISFFKILVSFLIILLTFSNLKSQDNSKLDFKPWTFNFNFGQTLFWGDGNNDILNPFGAYFKSDKSAYAYGLIVQKNFNSWLGIDFQYLGGQLKGTRYKWSNEVPANLNFNSNINSFGLNLDIDVFDIFMEPNSTRLFNFYVRGGGAYNLFNATEYNLLTNAQMSNVKDGAVEVVGGWGVRFDVSKKIGFTFENIFTYSFSDYLDAHHTQYSQASDIFAYTSLGFSYRIYPQPKKPSLENENDILPIDTVVAEEPIETKPEVTINVAMPGKMYGIDTSEVIIKIAKYELNESAKLQQTIPAGFIAKAKNSGESTFSFNDQIASFSWDNLPEDEENIELSYYLISNNVAVGTYQIPGIMMYSEGGKENISQFKQSITIEKPKPIAVAIVEQPIESPKQTTEQPTESHRNTEVLEYRVQVRAIYGGKSSPQSITRLYSLKEEVSEEFINGYSKYTAGHFATYEEAKAYKDQLRAGKVLGAFVVAYYKGQRISDITEAIKIENSNPSSAATNNVITMSSEGLSYSIQVAASSRELSANSIKNQFGLDQNVILTSHNGLFKYMVGSYTNYDEAVKELSNIRNKVSDAFIVKYVNGVRK